MNDIHPVLAVISLILGPGGAAWAAVRVALNGTREDVRELRADVRKMKEDIKDVSERVARLEVLK